jgi:two-component system chemotaxis sensor kinase CheA
MPLFSVSEMVRPSLEAVSTIQGNSEMVTVRGRLLPIVRLHQWFGISPRNTDPSQCLLIVTECEGKPYCLMVDEFIGKQEVVIKSLGECFRNVSGIAGGAILGDGRVGLILDATAIFRSGHSD